ncbi:hypothetical protein BKA10_002574 [Microbacterium invictum]|uniref:Rhodanese domain-containing protein n=1 Tax=Microbacterium invictum TaxID=515415 RepID=A0AA40SQX2_9MICO|nr:hypothetical protein [Microbacterium invictum]
MSNRRRSGYRNAYRGEFLRSPAWHARRDRWFTHHARLRRPLVCAACGVSGSRASLELHHLDYRGVVRRDGSWVAFEKHDDLVPMHPYCHELLHRLLDRDAVLAKGRSRRDASQLALSRLRGKLTRKDGHV